MDLTTTDENQVKSCHTSGFDTLTLRNCAKEVRSIQEKLDKAVANNDKTKIRWYCHILSKKSRAVKTLAVQKVCEMNQGRHTAGTDGLPMPKEKKDRLMLMESLLNSIDITKEPQPIRRVYIPKPDGTQRPFRFTVNFLVRKCQI